MQYTTLSGIQVTRTESKIAYKRGLKHLLRKLDTQRLTAQSEAGDLHAGEDLMIRPGEPMPDENLVSIPAESG